jgi:DNA repair protein RAD16
LLTIVVPSDHEDEDILLDSEEEGYVRPQNNWNNKRKMRRRAKLEKAHPEIKTMWKTLEQIPIIEPQQIAQPTAITRTLKSFQLEGVDWMIRQEKSSYKGGLLGDEMGMGKTIQAVSLIMSDFPAPVPSLVLVPPVALMQWQNEINAYTDGKLKILVVHGSNAKSKNLTTKMIKQYNVILMSYNSLESMYRKQEKGWNRGEDIVKANSPVHALKWHRIILDEAHSIKSRNTGSAKSCFALNATYKWCLSGTPVQNRIGEFFSLLRFLEVRPFADYFCEACDCSQLHWTIDAEYKCTSCKHSASEHRSVFNEEILNPITEADFEERDAALDKLHMITNRIMLRRMKKDHTSSMELPPKLIQIRNQFFSKIERDFSSSIMSNTVREFDTYVSRGVVLNNYANIFGLIMQMRQVANHPDLILRKNAEGGQNILVCNICDEPAEDAIRSQCKHDFCRSCVKSYVSTCTTTGDDIDCPRCHIPLSIDFEAPEIEQDTENVKKSSIINRIRMSDWTSSTKIELLIYELYKLRSSKRTLKSIVFSQFTSMLQLVEWRLRRAGFTTVMLDGSMTPVQRQRSIDYFMKNHHVEVFLVSLKAGGVALNLTEASRVFIIDP